MSRDWATEPSLTREPACRAQALQLARRFPNRTTLRSLIDLYPRNTSGARAVSAACRGVWVKSVIARRPALVLPISSLPAHLRRTNGSSVCRAGGACGRAPAAARTAAQLSLRLHATSQQRLVEHEVTRALRRIPRRAWRAPLRRVQAPRPRLFLVCHQPEERRATVRPLPIWPSCAPAPPRAPGWTSSALGGPVRVLCRPAGDGCPAIRRSRRGLRAPQATISCRLQSSRTASRPRRARGLLNGVRRGDYGASPQRSAASSSRRPRRSLDRPSSAFPTPAEAAW